MVISKRSLLLGATALCAAVAAQAQDNAPAEAVIGPPQLKDFSIGGRVITPAQPTEEAEPAAPPPGSTSNTSRASPAPASPGADVARPAPAQPSRPAPAPVQRSAPQPADPTSVQPALPETPSTSVADAPVEAAPAAPLAPPPAATLPDLPAPAPAGAPEAPATPWWMWALALLGVGGIGAYSLRRRMQPAVAGAAPAARRVAQPAPAAPSAPRPDPIPRPWLEVELKAERASFTDAEALLLFELEIANSGGSPARNLRVDVKMFNAGVEQDKEIGTFFKTAGRETTKLTLPGVEAGVTGVLKGSVKLSREEMRAIRLDEKLLFIPVVAVNILYDWGNGRTGQTSKSYLVGRELQQKAEKMGAFRVDQGPRVWRSVGQRPHKLAKRS